MQFNAELRRVLKRGRLSSKNGRFSHEYKKDVEFSAFVFCSCLLLSFAVIYTSYLINIWQ